MKLRTLIAASVCAVAGCGGDASKSTPDAAPVSAPLADFKKQQQRFADSVLNATSSAKDIAAKLGKNYDVGSTKLRDSMAVLALKANCHAVGQKVDPYLAGTVTMWVNMSAIGTDVIRVQESSWTSPAGKYVDACINQSSKKWQFDATFGKPMAYLIQIQFKPDAGAK